MLRARPSASRQKNYGRQGADISYHVEDATNHSKFYRQMKPVKITASNRGRRQSEQFITLKTAEWTAYTIDSGAAAHYAATSVRRHDGPADAQLEVNDSRSQRADRPNSLDRNQVARVLLNSGPITSSGPSKQGTVDLDGSM